MIRIAGREISASQPPFIIAEMSGNHNRSLERGYQLIDAAVAAGVHAIKLQTASPDGLTLDVDSPDFIISEPDNLWSGKKLYALYQEAVTPWEWHAQLFEYCREKGITVFSSPFELKAVDFLEELGSPCYKIASFELVDLQLVRRVAQTGKPVIISTGMASLSDIELAVNAVVQEGNNQIVLLKCTSTYPASPEDSNLVTIPHLRAAFNTEVGLSDHTMGVGVPCAAVALGATVIEKHFTLSRADGGVDAAFSLEPHELKQLVVETERAWKGCGTVCYGGSSREKASLKFRRSIYVCADIAAGETFTADNVRVVRPGYGLAPKFIEMVIGRRANTNLKKGTAMSWDYIG